MKFTKMQGAGNDYVYVNCFEETVSDPQQMAIRVSNRNFGIGSDGLILIMPSEVADVRMRMFNSDGSESEMCGNGIRVFARYLVDAGLAAAGELHIATRAGVHRLDVPASGDITVSLGAATTPMVRAMPVVSVPGGQWNATAVLVPNPHAVVFVDSLDEAGDLLSAPDIAPASVFPDGANVEFVERIDAGHVRMRVHERGVGETRSCGTGAVAVAWAARRNEPDFERAPTTWRVDVPGGTLTITEQPDGTLDLTGPAIIVATVIPDDRWWSRLSSL